MDGKRVLFAVGTLVLPSLMFARLLGKVLPKRRLLGRFLICLPCCLLAIVAWAVGEAAGYCAGPRKILREHHLGSDARPDCLHRHRRG